jgi:hypothetical protein
MRYLLLISLFLLLPLAAQSQTTKGGLANRNVGPEPAGTGTMGGMGGYDTTLADNIHTITGRIYQVFQPDHAITIVRPNGKQVRVVLNSQTRLRADKETDLAGRPSLTLGDFKPGQTVKITYFMDPSVVTEVRLRRSKN